MPDTEMNEYIYETLQVKFSPKELFAIGAYTNMTKPWYFLILASGLYMTSIKKKNQLSLIIFSNLRII